jgi:hypothetical protein
VVAKAWGEATSTTMFATSSIVAARWMIELGDLHAPSHSLRVVERGARNRERATGTAGQCSTHSRQCRAIPVESHLAPCGQTRMPAAATLKPHGSRGA